MKRYKGFYPAWYIEKRNNDGFKKVKGFLIFLLVINLILLPNILKKEKEFNLENKNEIIYEDYNILDNLGFLLSQNIDGFIIKNNMLEFKISKSEFKNKLKDLEKKINIRLIEKVLEDVYLVKGDFYGK